MPESLYERLGSKLLLISPILADQHVNHYFDGIDMEQQIIKQKGFLTIVFGGLNHYTGKGMREHCRDSTTPIINNTRVFPSLHGKAQNRYRACMT
jgi:hemoglobin